MSSLFSALGAGAAADPRAGNIAATVAASRPKYLPEYVMPCTLLGILDFPQQECQLNRKRDKLRALSLRRRQATMGNKDGEKRRPASSPGHNSSALCFKRTPVYLWRRFIARLLFHRGSVVFKSLAASITARISQRTTSRSVCMRVSPHKHTRRHVFYPDVGFSFG